MVQSHYRNQHGINDHLINYYTMDNRDWFSLVLISWLFAYYLDDYYVLNWLWRWSMLLVKFGSNFYSICILNLFHLWVNISLHNCNVTPRCHHIKFALELPWVVGSLVAWMKLWIAVEKQQKNVCKEIRWLQKWTKILYSKNSTK